MGHRVLRAPPVDRKRAVSTRISQNLSSLVAGDSERREALGENLSTRKRQGARYCVAFAPRFRTADEGAASLETMSLRRETAAATSLAPNKQQETLRKRSSGGCVDNHAPTPPLQARTRKGSPLFSAFAERPGSSRDGSVRLVACSLHPESKKRACFPNARQCRCSAGHNKIINTNRTWAQRDPLEYFPLAPGCAAVTTLALGSCARCNDKRQ